jgi:anti-sigma regulatory factor (Ser/Thr protein kinase)
MMPLPAEGSGGDGERWGSTAGDVVELELPVRPEVVSVARLVVGALAAAEPLFDDERAADLRLAVSEACTNAIQAQMRAGDETARHAPIRMRCRTTGTRIEVTVEDHGGGFDPDSLVAHPAVTDPERLEYERGLGIPLIRMLADDVRISPLPGGTSVFMGFEPRHPSSSGVHDPG